MFSSSRLSNRNHTPVIHQDLERASNPTESPFGRCLRRRWFDQEPDNKWLWQSRSVARALIDDLVGAAQDLQIVVDWIDSPQAPFLPEEFKSLRQNWLSTL
ncbi:MAG: hypothetical protein QNJ46_15245 [Leptolyngbyaceae cyanobacterium MO_188.B28]|nr:hypothetical protein [Leptolyngbyaceae cyanobacterium MO_188.B28]